MLKKLIGNVWRALPARARRWSMRLTQARFTVTAGALVFNDAGEILLLKHRFRTGSGWGIPGGFLELGEQPEEALRRELREEVGLEVDRVELFSSRSFRKPRQVEIVFRCRARGSTTRKNIEIKSADWFTLDHLPSELSTDQRQLINRVLNDGAKRAD